jgi:hypothetical protein
MVLKYTVTGECKYLAKIREEKIPMDKNLTCEHSAKICEACFIRQKREAQIAKAFPKGYRRFRYLVPAHTLERIPLRGGNNNGFRVSYSR